MISTAALKTARPDFIPQDTRMAHNLETKANPTHPETYKSKAKNQGSLPEAACANKLNVSAPAMHNENRLKPTLKYHRYIFVGATVKQFIAIVKSGISNDNADLIKGTTFKTMV
jgi:hypothetical protein